MILFKVDSQIYIRSQWTNSNNAPNDMYRCINWYIYNKYVMNLWNEYAYPKQN